MAHKVSKTVFLRIQVSMAGKDINDFLMVLSAHQGRVSRESYDISTPGRIAFFILVPEYRLANFQDMISVLPGAYQFSKSVEKA